MKKYIELLLIPLIPLVYSCDDEEATPPPTPSDTTKPTITVLFSSDITIPLRAIVSIKAEATDDNGIAMMEVFVDGVSIGSATTSPVEASWDTKTVADGQHQVKIVATDSEGNPEEKQIAVEVKNILFTFEIKPNYLTELRDGWIFISDEAGNLLQTKQMVNGETLTFDTPEGFKPGQKYTFNRLEYFFEQYDVGFFRDVFFVSYQDTEPGNYALGFNREAAPAPIGQFKIFIEALPNFAYSPVPVSLEAGRAFGSFSVDLTSFVPLVTFDVMNIYKSPAEIVYILINQEQESMKLNESPLEYQIQGAEVGSQATLNFNDFAAMNFVTIDIPDATRSSYFLSYSRNQGDYSNLISMFGQTNEITPNELRVYYPSLPIPQYFVRVSHDFNGGFQSYEIASAHIPTSIKVLQGNVDAFSVSDTKISITASGKYDYKSVTGYSEDLNFEVNEISSYSWSIFASREDTELVRPSIPNEIVAKYSELNLVPFTFGVGTLYENTELKDYQDWVKSRFSGDSPLVRNKERYYKTQYFFPMGGRIKEVSDHIRFAPDDVQFFNHR